MNLCFNMLLRFFLFLASAVYVTAIKNATKKLVLLNYFAGKMLNHNGNDLGERPNSNL